MTRIDLSNVKEAQQGEAYTWNVDIATKSVGSDPMTKAYLTLKTYPEGLNAVDPGASQKAITTSNVAGTGQIQKAAGGTAALRFDFTAAQMTALAQRDYVFDIKVIPTSGLPFYPDAGLFRVHGGVTLANS